MNRQQASTRLIFTACWKCSAPCGQRGDSVVVIEHNLDVIKTADYLIDLGPEGGLQGRPSDLGEPEGCGGARIIYGTIPGACLGTGQTSARSLSSNT